MPDHAGPQLHREPRAPGPVVTGFSGTGYRVGETLYPGGLLLTPDAAQPWDAPDFEALTIEAFAPVLVLSPPPEFLLLGTGDTVRLPPAALRAAIEARDIGLETMGSRAAARAWGVLRGEGRWIVAALMPLSAAA